MKNGSLSFLLFYKNYINTTSRTIKQQFDELLVIAWPEDVVTISSTEAWLLVWSVKVRSYSQVTVKCDYLTENVNYLAVCSTFTIDTSSRSLHSSDPGNTHCSFLFIRHNWCWWQWWGHCWWWGDNQVSCGVVGIIVTSLVNL